MSSSEKLTFQAFCAGKAAPRFSDWLVQRAGAAWHAATEHPFTKAIGDDDMPTDAYARYLIEDYAFIIDLASVLGYLVAKAPTMAAKACLSTFLAALTSSENDYFLRSFEALGVPENVYGNSVQSPVTQAFANLMLTSAGQGSYAEGLACLLCAEWAYLTWGEREVRKPRPQHFYLTEWIDLHAGPDFEGFVNWLRKEMDHIGQSLAPVDQNRVAECFEKMCTLEVAFFDFAFGIEKRD